MTRVSQRTVYELRQELEAKMNLILHGVEAEDMNLRNGDTRNKDWPTDEPYTFDSVVMKVQPKF